MRNSKRKKHVLFLTLFFSYFYIFSQTTIIASADAYTWNNYPEFNYNTVRLITSNDTDNSTHIREVFLKFNLSSLPIVTSAKLRLSLESDDLEARSYSAYLTNSWADNTITWNNSPTVIGASIAAGTSVGNLIEFDITSTIASAVSNNESSILIKIISNEEDVISLIYSTDTAPSNAYKPRIAINEPTLSLNSELNSDIETLVLYPNPTAANLHIKGIENEATTVFVYNTLGQLLMDEKYKSGIDLSHLKSGLYYVKVINTLGLKTFSVIKK